MLGGEGALGALAALAGCWFTSSTSFANPAVAAARSLTDNFSGIRPVDVPASVAVEFVGAGLAALVFGGLLAPLGDIPAPAPADSRRSP